MSKKNIVLCPVYNEHETIEIFFHDLRECYSDDLLFIDDGSIDCGKAWMFGIRNENTFLIRHEKRRGYGAALLSGFKYSLAKGYSKIVTIDVDLQHNPKHIHSFLDGLEEVEVVLGSRYKMSYNHREIPSDRLIINKYIARLIFLLSGVSFSDPFCGFRGYRDSFLKTADLKQMSYGLGLEIILEIIRTKAAFKETPIEVIYDDRSRSFLDGLDNPRKRLLYYLDILSERWESIKGDKMEFPTRMLKREGP